MALLERILITPHAYDRLKERLNEKLNYQNVAWEAWTRGEHLTQPEMHRMIERGLFAKNYWIRYYKKHKNLVFVFNPVKNGKTVLITVLPI